MRSHFGMKVRLFILLFLFLKPHTLFILVGPILWFGSYTPISLRRHNPRYLHYPTILQKYNRFMLSVISLPPENLRVFLQSISFTNMEYCDVVILSVGLSPRGINIRVIWNRKSRFAQEAKNSSPPDKQAKNKGRQRDDMHICSHQLKRKHNGYRVSSRKHVKNGLYISAAFK